MVVGAGEGLSNKTEIVQKEFIGERVEAWGQNFRVGRKAKKKMKKGWSEKQKD